MIRTAANHMTYLIVAAMMLLALVSMGSTTTATAAPTAAVPMSLVNGVSAHGGNVATVTLPLVGTTGGGGNR